MFCRYLLEDLEHKITEKKFNEQINKNYNTFGKHSITGFVALHRNPENVIIIWKVGFEKRQESGLLMYRFKEYDSKMLVEG